MAQNRCSINRRTGDKKQHSPCISTEIHRSGIHRRLQQVITYSQNSNKLKLLTRIQLHDNLHCKGRRYRACLHVVLRDDPQKVDVIVRVEAGHLLTAYGLRSKHLHLTVEAVVHYEVMCHTHPVRLHRMSRPVVIIPNLGCERNQQMVTSKGLV